MIEVTKHGGRAFAVVEDGNLLAVCVYRKGAVAVKERLETLQASVRELAAKTDLREPLVWEECFDSPKPKDSTDGHEGPAQEGVGRAPKSGGPGIPAVDRSRGPLSARREGDRQ